MGEEAPKLTTWRQDEEQTLLELSRSAGGSLKTIAHLAAEALPDKSYYAIRDKLRRMELSRKAQHQSELRRRRLEQASMELMVLRLANAPKKCPKCGGQWRLDRDPAAGAMLVCWSCSAIEYVS